MAVIDNIVDQLKRDEGLKLIPYKDTSGLWTVGYGHKMKPGDGLSHPEYVEWGEPHAEHQLQADLQNVNLQLTKNLPWVWDLDVARRGVFQNMCFNMGINRLLGFVNTLALAEQGQYARASGEMLKSKWRDQVGDRAIRLADQMRLGAWV